MASPPAAPPGPRPAPPLYRSAAAEASIAQVYDAALQALPFAHEERIVETASFGSVHVTVCGPPEAPPLVLWHGTAAPGPYMLTSMGPLVERLRIYVPDIPCQAGGRSQAVVLDPATHGHGRWCAEVVEALGLAPTGPAGPAGAAGTAALPPLHLGVSLGGALLLDLATVRPEHIRAAVLVVPGSLNPGWDSRSRILHVTVQLLLPALLYRLLPCTATAWLMLAGMCDEPLSADPVMTNVKLAFRFANYFPDAPPKATPATLRALGEAGPVLVVGAERDIFGPGAGTVERAQREIPGCEAALLPGCRHLPSAARMQRINALELDFFERHGLLHA